MIENIGAYSQVDYDRGYQQGIADALSIDMDKPMHFTDEQKAWIKNYIIINAKRQRADAIEDVWNKANEHSFTDALGIRGVDLSVLENILEQLKQQNSK